MTCKQFYLLKVWLEVETLLRHTNMAYNLLLMITHQIQQRMKHYHLSALGFEPMGRLSVIWALKVLSYLYEIWVYVFTVTKTANSSKVLEWNQLQKMCNPFPREDLFWFTLENYQHRQYILPFCLFNSFITFFVMFILN